MTDTPRRPLIELRGIEKFYGDFHALKSIDLDIGEGEFFSLLGPSGCGKTTLLRTIAGFEDPGAGTLRIDGIDMAGVPANRRPTNMVFQSYAIFPHMTVAGNVGFGLRRRSDLDARAREALIAEALEMVGLAGYGARSAQALSGGQRQRVALARALILKPKVLLLDEPLSALDRKLREHMQVELIRLQRHVGITFILVTHDQEEALVMSDRIAVMFEGRIAQLDAPERLYKRPATRAVAEFIGSMNFLPGRIVERGDTIDLEIAGLGRASVDPAQCVEVSEGPTCHVGVRPETMSIRFEGEAPGPGRTAEGAVSEVVYYGDMTYYDILLDGAERPVRISMRNLVGRPVLDVGTRTAITWDPRSLVLFS